MNIRTRQTISAVLSLVSSVGTIATAYLAAKATKKIIEKKNDISSMHPEVTKEQTDNMLKKNSKFKYFFKYEFPTYIPTFICGTATIISTVSSTILSRKTEASLATMALLADQGWRKYRGKVISTLGLDKNENIVSAISKDEYKKENPKETDDGRKLYWEEHIGFFLAFPDAVALAYGDLNQRIHTLQYGVSSYYAMLYDFVTAAKAELLNKNISNEDLQWGWSYDELEASYDCIWVHMEYHKEISDDGTEYTQIIFTEPPILDPGNHGEDFLGIDESDTNTDFKVEHEYDTFLKAGSGD